MDDVLFIDLYAWAALAAYLGTVALVAGVLCFRWLAGRSSAWAALQGAIAASGKSREDLVWAALPSGGFLLYARGGTACVVGDGGDHHSGLRSVDRIALVKDMDQQTGLVFTIEGANVCVTGLDAMARIWSLLQREETRVHLVFREDEGETMQKAIKDLHANEQQLLGQWLTEDEIVTDVIKDVDYIGKLESKGSKGTATLVVTNLRVGLLARTVETQTSGNSTRTTTHFNLLGYLMPAAEMVTLQRTPKIGAVEFVMRLALPPEHENAEAPDLQLTRDHAGVFLPLVIFRRPVQVRQEAAGLGRWAFETAMAGLGWGILLGGLMLIVSLILTEGDLVDYGRWWYRYTVPLILGGALTPVIFRGWSLLGDQIERSRASLAGAEQNSR
jgi:hypothetical protein